MRVEPKTYDDVTAAFIDGSVLNANKATLEQLLLTIATTRVQSDVNRAVSTERGETIRLLLTARQSQQMHNRSMIVAVVALVVLFVSLGISIAQWLLPLTSR